MDLTSHDLEEAKNFWENHLLPLLECGPYKPYPTPEAINLLAQVLKKKVIGRFDELMTDQEVVELMHGEAAIEQARRELVGCHHRLNELSSIKTKPTPEQSVKMQFQSVMKIAKILEMDN